MRVCILQRNGHSTASSENNECEIENIHLERVGHCIGIIIVISIKLMNYKSCPLDCFTWLCRDMIYVKKKGRVGGWRSNPFTTVSC